MIRLQPSRLRILSAAALAGIIIGCVARAVKFLIARISALAAIGFKADHSNWWLLLLGVASIVLSGLVVRKIVRRPLEHATGRIKSDLANGIAPLPRRLMIAPVGVNALTLGLGGSAGAEGPIAYTGAAIASRIAKRLNLTHEQTLAFLACGAGAGIAAIFKAPIGGMFFTIEVLSYPLAPALVLLLAVMCLFAGLTAYAAGGFIPEIMFTSPAGFDVKWLLPAVAIGIACGVYSIYYKWCGSRTTAMFSRISVPWKRNVAAGLALGVCLLLFPAIYGEGYGVLQKLLNGDSGSVTAGTFLGGMSGPGALAAVLAGILLIKSFATYTTNSGGGVAGEFAPTIFAGGMLGALLAMGASAIPGLSAMPAGNYMVIAMAAAMAGIINAPLMAIFIVVEMTQSAILLLPVCVASGISCMIVNFGKFSKNVC
ncbi:MAG: chloride channel protein [Muribaculaceae bacterium]|nr:chloride channel protein [Muribaculaceae bacterium]